MLIVIVLLDATSTVIETSTIQRVAFELQHTQHTNQTVLPMAVVDVLCDQDLAGDRIEDQKFESCLYSGQIRQQFCGINRMPRCHCCSGRGTLLVQILSRVSAYANILIQQRTSAKRQTNILFHLYPVTAQIVSLKCNPRWSIISPTLFTADFPGDLGI